MLISGRSKVIDYAIDQFDADVFRYTSQIGSGVFSLQLVREKRIGAEGCFSINRLAFTKDS